MTARDRAITIIGPDGVAALEAAGLTVVERELVEWLAQLPCYRSVGQAECRRSRMDRACPPHRARWRIAEREKGKP